MVAQSIFMKLIQLSPNIAKGNTTLQFLMVITLLENNETGMINNFYFNYEELRNWSQPAGVRGKSIPPG